MAFHIGKKIKEELYQQGISVSVFAKKINRSRNVVYDIFERESIDTDLLQKISVILKFNFFELYNNSKKANIAAETSNNYYTSSEHQLLLEQKNKALESEILYLKKIISLLEKDKTPKPYKKAAKKKA